MRAKTINENTWADSQDWNVIYNDISQQIKIGNINNEIQLKKVIDDMVVANNYSISDDDIEDAAWAAWNDAE